MQWAGEDWGSPASETLFSGDDRLYDKAMKIEEEGLLEDIKGGFPSFSSSSSSSARTATEVKIKITKKQLEELLGKVDVQGLSVQQVLAQLMNAGDQFETHQRSWRPALQRLDLDFDLEAQHTVREDPSCKQAQQSSTTASFPKIEEDDDFESPTIDPHPQVSDRPQALKRLRRGRTTEPVSLIQKLESVEERCDFDDDIEELSSQEDQRKVDIPSSTQYHSMYSSSKYPLHGHGVLNTQSTEPVENVNEETKKVDSSSKERQSNPGRHATASEQKRTKASVSTSQTEDLWKNFCSEKSFHVPTPVLDEVCEEYFRSVKNKNEAQNLRSEGCTGNNKGCYQNSRVGKNDEHHWDLGNPLPPAHCYFFHDNPRIQKLVRSRLPNFYPLSAMNNRENKQPSASAIDYMSQFSHGEGSKQQATGKMNYERSLTKGTRNSKKSNAEEVTQGSGSWVNPKQCAGNPKDAGKRRVHAVGHSSGHWYTASDGKRVYVTKNGQELTGRMAYTQYRKENGKVFKRLLRMENTGVGAYIRNRTFGSYFDANTGSNLGGPSKVVVKEEVGLRPKADAYVDDDGWCSVLISWIRIVVCFLTMMFTTFIWALIMLLLLPWPYHRIRQGNIYGHVTGRLLMWILGNPIKIEGIEYSNERAIYISNHASPIDIFLIMWLTPTGTVGIAKKEKTVYDKFEQQAS
ncbi:hypothetical protein F0562_008796 [Nyssa sinensis]|uniref:Phospholipid/glycerol acyltransferase domain-containing protein n=1 Tax=Nyssa sinensis TaxID=561372 RepID=A0A5J5A795_9ASTE|nr:hypothetical protein F0562_008796 [Nyssa sinensis]